MTIAALLTGRQWIRTTLATITIANGYAVELKAADLDYPIEDPMTLPASSVPRAAVYVTTGAGTNVTFGTPMWHAWEPVTVDIFFDVPLLKSDGRDRYSRDICTTWVDAVWTALQTAQKTAEASATPPLFKVAPDGAAGYHVQDGARTSVRIPCKVSTSWKP